MNRKNNTPQKTILILGAGAFGTAIAQLLSHKYQITIWTRNKTVAREINEEHNNATYLPDVRLSNSISAITTLQNGQHPWQCVIIAVPSFAVKKTIHMLSNRQAYDFLITAKGLDTDTGQTLEQVCLTHHPASTVTMLAGPNYAKELAVAKQSIAVLGYRDTTKESVYGQIFRDTGLQLLTTQDIQGLQFASTYKHLAAMYNGICDALNQHIHVGTHNLTAYFLHAYWQELTHLFHLKQCQASTMYLSPVLGDLFISCQKQSRNYNLGYLLIKNPHGAECRKLYQACEGSYATNALVKAVSPAQLKNLPLLQLLHTLLQHTNDNNLQPEERKKDIWQALLKILTNTDPTSQTPS